MLLEAQFTDRASREGRLHHALWHQGGGLSNFSQSSRIAHIGCDRARMHIQYPRALSFQHFSKGLGNGIGRCFGRDELQRASASVAVPTHFRPLLRSKTPKSDQHHSFIDNMQESSKG
mgnify:CR=1 FL=1